MGKSGFCVDNLQYDINKLIDKGLNKSSSLRRTRRLITNYYNYYVNKGFFVYFITFTFNDENLPFNRIKFVNYLRNTCKKGFILYNDYGKKNNRFHLHGFCVSRCELDLSIDMFNKFGFVKICEIKTDIIKYIVKYSTKFNFSTFRLIHIKPKI